jgi:queuosine precursor transporter
MSDYLTRIDGSTGARRHFRYFDYVMAAFVAILLLANLIGAAKLSVVDLSWLTGALSWLPWHWLGIGPDGLMIFGAGILFFPLSYVIGDVLTEVYGYAHARRCVWMGFGALLFMAFMSTVVVAMPPAAGWQGQVAYESVFGATWRIVAASILAFWAGEFVNSFVLAKMKILTSGRHLWSRTIGSTFFGQAVDSMIFYPVAFLGIWTTEQVLAVMVTNWLLKVLWEALLTPVTYAVVGWFKAHEGVDVYDTGTDFSPFAKTESM